MTPIGVRLRRFATRPATLAVGSSAGTLATSLVTGVVLARSIGATGRGETTILTTVPLIFTWVFGLGSIPVISYFRARGTPDAAVLLATWLLLLVPIGAIAIGTSELLVDTIFAAQTSSTRDLGRIAAPMIGVLLVNEVALGFVVGDQRFRLFAFLRIATPGTIAVAYVVLAALDALTTTSAVASFFAVQCLFTLGLTTDIVRRHGLSRPEVGVARETVWFGFRGHAMQLGQAVNARLDLLIMPAILAAAPVGLYSVATNVSWIVYALPSAIATFLVPRVAGSSGTELSAAVRRAVVVTATIATLTAVPLLVGSSFVVRIVYGDAFVPASPSLRILLPGSVALAIGQIYLAALVGLGRPGLAAGAMVAGAVVTVVGLLLTLRSNGIEAAAWTSTVAYTIVLIGGIAGYRRATRAGAGSRAPAMSERDRPEEVLP